MDNPEIVSAQHYYDHVAMDYDQSLSAEKDVRVRNEIKDYFRRCVDPGQVLDFGGGTGLDLPWLITSGYQVYFCEPADQMRARAVTLSEKLQGGHRPVFLMGIDTDFRQWKPEASPMNLKLNGVLANFGVINYIEALPLFFKQMHWVLGARGSLIINLLHIPRGRLLTKYFKNTVKALIQNDFVKLYSRHEQVIHNTTLYPIGTVEKAAKPCFALKCKKRLGDNSDFYLLHFERI